MGLRRAAVVVGVTVLLADVIAQLWINGHTVDLVVVNASGTPVEIAMQAGPGLPQTLENDPGCASHSLPVSRGTTWSVARDGDVVLDSASAGLPLLASMVAVEVWLDPDGSVRIVPPYEITRLVDAPYPGCQESPSGDDE